MSCCSILIYDLQSFKGWCTHTILSNASGKALPDRTRNSDTSRCWRKHHLKCSVWNKYQWTLSMWLSHLKQQWRPGSSTHSDTNQWSIFPLKLKNDQKGAEDRNCVPLHSAWTLRSTTTPTVYINVLSHSCFHSITIFLGISCLGNWFDCSLQELPKRAINSSMENISRIYALRFKGISHLKVFTLLFLPILDYCIMILTWS